MAIGQREVAVPYRWGRVRLCKRYGVICTATPRHPGRPIMSHARAGRCATGVHRCFMRPGISAPAVRGAAARRFALARGRVASFSASASAAADDQDPPCRLKSGWLRHRRAPRGGGRVLTDLRLVAEAHAPALRWGLVGRRRGSHPRAASSGAAAPLAHPLQLRGAEPPLSRYPAGRSTHPS